MANGDDFKGGGSPWGSPPGGDPHGLPFLKSFPFAMTLYIVILIVKTS